MKHTGLVFGFLVSMACLTGEAYSQSKDTLDTRQIESIIGLKGKTSKGEFKITIPQNDLNVWVDSFKIIPPMGTGSWVAFTPTPTGAMLMGDLVLTETDIKPVQQELIRQGLTTSAIHNHFIRNHPNIVFMHAGGMGATADLARKIKAVLDKINESRGHNPAASPADSVINTLDIKMLDGILGYTGEMSKGVYKYTIGRPDVTLKEHGTTITSFMGFNTWAAWQGTPEHAAVAGDFTMLENEVEPVLKALISNGIEVVALHTHMVHENPRIFFLHYWGVGNAEQLAKGLKAALNETGKKHAGEMKM
ncbi:MAG TPA: DUF1259 domain-containing protein [Puia sp.]|nr:DUF1259 domain-containing protein [Puia sp.]